MEIQDGKAMVKMPIQTFVWNVNPSWISGSFVGEDEAGGDEDEDEERLLSTVVSSTTAPVTSNPNNKLTTFKLSVCPVVSNAKIVPSSISTLGVRFVTVYSANASMPVTPNIDPARSPPNPVPAPLEDRFLKWRTKQMVLMERRERTPGPMKRYPRRPGKRKVGIAAKRRGREFASAYAEAMMGKVESERRIAVGVARARIGFNACCVERGAV